jgi:hypothetical protein
VGSHFMQIGNEGILNSFCSMARQP